MDVSDLINYINARIYQNGEQLITGNVMNDVLVKMTTDLGSNSMVGNLTGYITLQSIQDLPLSPSTIGYLIDGDLYVWVGTGGDTLDGKYQDCGPLRGPQGERGIGFQSVTSAEDGTIVITLTDGNTITIDLNHNHPAYYSKVAETNNPSGGFLPDVVYSLGTLTGSVTFALAAAVTGNVNHYFFMFSTGGTAPTITWPTGITWAAGSAPTVAANKKYEISILDGVAYYSEV